MNYCSKGHENPAHSRFCLHCGEKLDSVTYGIQRGQTLGDRYVIVRQLGQGGFGRTYLAEDVNRFREPCVLKEFSPQVQTAYVLQKAEELFEREASVLYKLQHPQIPRFRELFRTNLDGKEYLFLVQDYVEGQTYRDLLEVRKQQGLRFTEAEVRQLLQQILPVLEYIHGLGVIHRDISPDNLILHTPQVLPNQGRIEGVPVLIDFGGVKQVAATVASQYYQPGSPTPSPPTLLGKIGYAPPEQMQTGLVKPHSDLYALAATVVVLLTLKQPQELIDTYTLTWQWRREVSLSPVFGVVLDKMLSPVPSDRYQSAIQVLQALTSSPVSYPSTQNTNPDLTVATVAVAPSSSKGGGTPPLRAHGRTDVAAERLLQTRPQNSWTPGKILLVALVLMTAAGVVSWGVTSWIKSRYSEDSSSIITPQPTPNKSANPTPSQPTDPFAKYSLKERQRKQILRDRRQQLGLDYNFYVKLVNQVFRDRNPIGTRTLSDGPEDESLREKWDLTAAELLEKLAVLSSNARQQLGTYTAAERDRWKVEVNQINVGSRSLYALGDAAFFQQFPEQRGKNFINQPIGQVWHGFVNDKLNAILAGSAFEKIVFESGATGKTVTGTLKSADGKVFIAGLAKNQLMDLKLEANPKLLLSVYSPSGKIKLLENSTQRNLSVKLPEDGFYEFVVVCTASEPVDYQLSLRAENPTPPSSPTPTPTETTTPTPTVTATSTPKPTFTPTTETTPQ